MDLYVAGEYESSIVHTDVFGEDTGKGREISGEGLGGEESGENVEVGEELSDEEGEQSGEEFAQEVMEILLSVETSTDGLQSRVAHT
ncbi:Hypothetical protein PHPALM_9280 [Phytophthora palmivora]|uniref:Uncharacterized protein n=1 Tax=Phytophthora palmivora TaxID=4796 RepID=A0A2P4Y7P8_9STRA|nr:Hypothetical protein PHPALM_9280 [Phytophthora palmivora]